jgi:hypothetical protein
MTIELVISGGQTGADIGGVKAAKSLGYATSGWMPKGWRTLDGPRPQYAEMYGMKEHSSSSYNERTWDNVLWADGTLRIAGNFNSPGEKCTVNAVLSHKKPVMDISIAAWNLYNEEYKNRIYKTVKDWIEDRNIKILNVAGNSEKTWLGIEEITIEIVRNIL